MLDSYHIRSEEAARYPQHVHLPAPAEMLEMLDRMRDAARREVESRVNVGVITLGDVAVYKCHELDGWRVLFCVNGHNHSVTVHAHDIAQATGLANEAAARVIAESITARILVPLLSGSAALAGQGL